ncbi:hypothetical protein SAMN05660816_03858 [Niastella yeongjuensis]|nr:hypothetical protein [Niastella yeongjuensis]SEO92505.1 hypothetical protein SAMN05660816_03858 [Niastella yeongjuensis]
MGDWNTLHIFNDRYFFEHLVPDFKGDGTIFKNYWDSPLGKSILWGHDNGEARTQHMIELCRQLQPDFKVHEKYYEILNRKKKPTETYEDFRLKQHQDEDLFLQMNTTAIEDLNILLQAIIFSECAAFNPHLILGRRIFTGNIEAKDGSIADEVISQVMYQKYGSLYYCYTGGVMNWITYEELQLMWLDKENLRVAADGAEQYLHEFLAFAELALQHTCGFISVTNVREEQLNAIENPRLKINLDTKEKGYKYVINYPC